MLARALLLSLAFLAAPALANAQGDTAARAAKPVLGVSAQDSALDARTREVAAQLRCPVCQGQSLQDSGSELAREMRGLITDQLRAGKSPAEVKQYFVSKYGEWILLQPEAHGINLLAYGLPVLLLLGGLGGLFFAARRWMRQPVPVEGPAAEGPAPQDVPAPVRVPPQDGSTSEPVVSEADGPTSVVSTDRR